MTKTPFKSIAYLLHGCPFCMKFQIFLLEAGLVDQVELRAFDRNSDGETAARATLAPHFEKVGFPTVEVTPGEFLSESDALVAWFAERADVKPATLPVYNDYVSGVFTRHLELFRENIALKQAAV